MKYSIIAGLFGGLLTIGSFLICYAIEPILMLNPMLYWGSMLFFLLAMLGACLLKKREGNGVLGFRQAVRTAFLTFLVANLLFLAFYFIMFNSVDPNLPILQKEQMIEYYEQSLRGGDLQKQLESLKDGDFGLKYSDLFYGFSKGAIGGFILSLLMALLVRQEA